jgi:hypothetical protein
MSLPTSKITGLTPKQAIFVAELEKHGIPARAAETAGYKHPSSAGAKLINPEYHPFVAAAVGRALERRKGSGIKTADEVLKYIHCTMFFNPLHFFEPGDQGGWLVDESKWSSIPPEIGCLIESVELRTVTVETLAGCVTSRKVWVKLVSKTQAMMLAARHQLGDKHAITVAAAAGVDWDDLARRGSMVDRGSELEERIRETEVSRERMMQIEQGVEKAPIQVEVKVGKVLKDEP